MRAYDLIYKKRNGESLAPDTIFEFIEGYTKGDVPDYQMSAFAMAVFFRGMDATELAALTDAMLHSGVVVDLSDLSGAKIDKHSTGGVGDKVSLPLAPAVAACGVRVPMVSGRGLGHTGGTLDKLESIPGFNVNLDVKAYRSLVDKVGCCLIGQTGEVAPADKKLYALRDVTATVDCIPLIASSIMSKKLAEGIDGLVLDVKTGRGAFMKNEDDARTLAKTMVDLGTAMDKKVVARLTNMDQPLGHMVGNALEVQESLDILEGHGPQDLVALVEELGGEMLVLGDAARDLDEGRAKIHAVLQNGKAREKFGEIIRAQDGDAGVLDDRSRLPSAPRILDLRAPRDGHVLAIDAQSVGIASMMLGGGRERSADPIDPRVGIEVLVEIGDEVKKGDLLGRLHVADKGIEDAQGRLASAFELSEDKVDRKALFLTRISVDGEEAAP
jgi:pyrimidine-nucleoside phosphorylase